MTLASDASGDNVWQRPWPAAPAGQAWHRIQDHRSLWSHDHFRRIEWKRQVLSIREHSSPAAQLKMRPRWGFSRSIPPAVQIVE